MIKPMVLIRIFYCQQIPHIFYNADERWIPSPVGTDGTELSVGNIVALSAKPCFPCKPDHCFAKPFHISSTLPEHMQNHSHCTAPADSGQGGEFIYGLFKYPGGKGVHVDKS